MTALAIALLILGVLTGVWDCLRPWERELEFDNPWRALLYVAGEIAALVVIFSVAALSTAWVVAFVATYIVLGVIYCARRGVIG